MERFIMVLLAITIIFVGSTYVISLLSKKIRIIKYIPGVITMVLGLYYISVARQTHTGFEGLALGLLAIMLIWASLSNLVTSVVIDFLIPMIKDRKKK